MYLARIRIENFRCFGEGVNGLDLSLKPDMCALVGENEAGKSAIIDALRFVFGTTDQESNRLDDSDFCDGNLGCQITINCTLKDLSDQEKAAFVEYLTYEDTDQMTPVLYLNWSAKDSGQLIKGKKIRHVELHSGKDGTGPAVAAEVRERLRATYLRPLRDAEQALSAGRGSRLAQVLYHTPTVTSTGVRYDPKQPLNVDALNVLGIADLANALLEKQQGIVDARESIDIRLNALALAGDDMKSSIRVAGTRASEEVRLRQLLEKLDLTIPVSGKVGLGSNNLLFMACELLLLGQETVGSKLLLIEEPEAHLHTQRQLRVMRSLRDHAVKNGIQIIVTTHSPSLASAIEVTNLVIVQDGRAFPLTPECTQLDISDYRFLQRFLDATKANLFFARGVVIVEGDAENILLPVIASLIERDFTEHGVSVVNVGGVGLRRYARIFQRKNLQNGGPIKIPVACVTDMDVMPDCAPLIVGIVEAGQEWPSTAKRRWRVKRDFTDNDALKALRASKNEKASGQSVATFVADEWTLEYDLALGPKDAEGKNSLNLAEEVFVAASLAEADHDINSKKTDRTTVESNAHKEYAAINQSVVPQDGCGEAEVLAAMIYAKFAKDKVSKPIAAQYLAELLTSKRTAGQFSADDLRMRLPKYLVAAIDYVTPDKAAPASETATQ